MEQKLHKYQDRQPGPVAKQVAQTLYSFQAADKLEDIANLKQPALFGVDIGAFVPESIPEGVLFFRPECLNLESCHGEFRFIG